MARREPRDDADGCADVQAERRRFLVRRALLASRVRQLVAAERRHVEAEIAEHVERLVEAFVGVALARQRADEDAPLVEDLLLEIVSDALDIGAIVLCEVLLLERGVQRDERGADPRIEGLDVATHRGPMLTARVGGAGSRTLDDWSAAGGHTAP